MTAPRRRPAWGSKSRAGGSTLGVRGDAADAIARRVVAWRRQDAADAERDSQEGKTMRQVLDAAKQKRLEMRDVGEVYRREARAADPRLTDEDLAKRFTPEKVLEEHRRRTIDRLLRDLRPLADSYVEADRKHQAYSVDALASADADALLERLNNAPSDARRKRVQKAAEKWLTSDAQRFRLDPKGGPVLLRSAGDGGLDGHQAGRGLRVDLRDALRWPRCAPPEPFIGPELPPGEDQCWCHGRPEGECPRAEPCGARCGRLTRNTWCRFCSHRDWLPAAWAGSESAIRARQHEWDEWDRRAERARRDVAAAEQRR